MNTYPNLFSVTLSDTVYINFTFYTNSYSLVVHTYTYPKYISFMSWEDAKLIMAYENMRGSEGYFSIRNKIVFREFNSLRNLVEAMKEEFNIEL